MLMRDFGKRETREHRPNFEGTWAQRKYWGTGNIRKHLFLFEGQVLGEQIDLFQGNKETGFPVEGLAIWEMLP